MAARNPATKGPTKTGKKKASGAFTDEERAAMKEHAREVKGGKTEGEGAVLAKIATMAGQDRVLAERIHALVRSTAPDLRPKTWYGMPAYANEEGKVVCFFQDAGKFKARYATFSFTDSANLDDGALWVIGFAVKDLTAAGEAKLRALVKQAVS
jgi:uncharacterized protein YdhG (YjbR/CyaY superfamily)